MNDLMEMLPYSSSQSSFHAVGRVWLSLWSLSWLPKSWVRIRFETKVENPRDKQDCPNILYGRQKREDEQTKGSCFSFESYQWEIYNHITIERIEDKNTYHRQLLPSDDLYIFQMRKMDVILGIEQLGKYRNGGGISFYGQTSHDSIVIHSIHWGTRLGVVFVTGKSISEDKTGCCIPYLDTFHIWFNLDR